jgi:hypothetical protein
MLGKVAVERLAEQEKANKQLRKVEVKRSFALAQSANIDLEKKVDELAEALRPVKTIRRSLRQHLSSPRRSWRRFKRLTKTILV